MLVVRRYCWALPLSALLALRGSQGPCCCWLLLAGEGGQTVGLACLPLLLLLLLKPLSCGEDPAVGDGCRCH